jgi:release factor glutamine methyltransferase
MYTYAQAFDLLRKQLVPLYDERESAAIAHEVVSHITSLSKVQRLVEKNSLLTAQQQLQFESCAEQLVKGVPLQYVTGTAWFMGKEYAVNNNVLIPRPETEELVQWVINEQRNKTTSIIDIGTGSGCIPVSLKLALPGADVAACDISEGALAVARQNAARLTADVAFLQLDFLEAGQQNKLGMFGVIVSNPPYIPFSEKERLHTNVRDNEPGIALFVPNDDALVFYRAIAQFGKNHLTQDGKIYCELDAEHAEACKALFEAEGYWDVTLRKDMFDNWRFLSAQVG